MAKQWKKISTAVIAVLPYNRKDGQIHVKYYAVAGCIPNRHIVAPIIAQNAGFEIGNKYEVDIIETDPDDVYGRRFIFQNCGIWNKSAKAAKLEYGEGKVMQVEGSPMFTSIGGELESPE